MDFSHTSTLQQFKYDSTCSMFFELNYGYFVNVVQCVIGLIVQLATDDVYNFNFLIVE
jgi:hypothetical protein